VERAYADPSVHAPPKPVTIVSAMPAAALPGPATDAPILEAASRVPPAVEARWNRPKAAAPRRPPASMRDEGKARPAPKKPAGPKVRCFPTAAEAVAHAPRSCPTSATHHAHDQADHDEQGMAHPTQR
jgi:hypothetical protein